MISEMETGDEIIMITEMNEYKNKGFRWKKFEKYKLSFIFADRKPVM